MVDIKYEVGEDYHAAEHSEKAREMLVKALREFHRLYDGSQYEIHVGESFTVGRVEVRPDFYVCEKGKIPIVCVDIGDKLSVQYLNNIKLNVYECLGIPTACIFVWDWKQLRYNVLHGNGKWDYSTAELNPEKLVPLIKDERPDLTEEVIRKEYIQWSVRLSTGHILNLANDLEVE